MDALHDELKPLLDDARHGGGGLVRSMEKVIEVLKRHGMAWTQQLHSRFVGCHPCNRDGQGIQPDHVHSLCQSLFKSGYSQSEAKNWCIEVGADEHAAVVSFNVDLVQRANGLSLVHRYMHVDAHALYSFFHFMACHDHGMLMLMRVHLSGWLL